MINLRWSDAPCKQINTVDEWNELIKWLADNGHKVEQSKTKYIDWLKDNSYNFDHRYNVYTIYTTFNTREGKDILRYEYRPSNSCIDRIGEDGTEYNGTNSRKWLDGKFKARTGKSLRVAFGIVDNKNDFEGFNYSPIIWTDPKACKFRRLKNIYKADVSSAYAFEGSKMLPDAHTAIRRKGHIEPTAEYPFAFYIKSNQLKIYGELDTAECKDYTYCNVFNDFSSWHKLNPKYFDRFHNVETLNEETILMKVATERLRPEFLELYEGRHEHPYYKSIYVSAIGNIASLSQKINDKNEMRHITAVIYARHLIRMFKLLKELEKAGAWVISVATDCIVWASKKDLKEIYDEEKTFGAFFLENKNCSARFFRQGVYAIEEGGKINIIKQQGIGEKINVENKTLENLDFIEYIKTYKIDKETGVIENGKGL